MPFDVRLLNRETGEPFKTESHRLSYRFDPSPDNTTDATWVSLSNMVAWAYNEIQPTHGPGVCVDHCKGDRHPRHGVMLFPDALRALLLDAGHEYDEDYREVVGLLHKWANEHPEGYWEAL